MLKALAWLTDHPPIAAVAIALAGFAGGWLAHRPPQPAVHLEDHSHYEDDLAELVQIHQVAGPERVVVRRYAVPAAGCAQGAVVEESTTERGTVTTDTGTKREEHQVADRKLDLTVTPQPRPGWAVGVGLEDVLHGGQVRVAVRRRLLGPFWAEAAVQPATRALGVGLSVEW